MREDAASRTARSVAAHRLDYHRLRTPYGDPAVASPSPVTGRLPLSALLARRGWPVLLEEQPTDHAGVIGTEYDPSARRCVPATAGPAVAAGRLSARMIAASSRTAHSPGVTRPDS